MIKIRELVFFLFDSLKKGDDVAVLDSCVLLKL